jgi:putative DNA methylase
MPLVRSFALSTKKDKQARVEPVIEHNSHPPTIRFTVRTGTGVIPDGTVIRTGARCLACGTPVPFDHVRSEGKAGKMGAQMMAIVAEGKKGRIYLSPSAEHEVASVQAKPKWQPETNLPEKALGFRVQLYGMLMHSDLFSSRQLLVLSSFSDLVRDVQSSIQKDASRTKIQYPGDYADAVCTYLAFAVDKMTTTNSALCTWQTEPTRLVAAFSRQALPMVWDYAEANPFSDAAGDYRLGILSITEVLERLPGGVIGNIRQENAMELHFRDFSPLISTDPPYYDNIGYADLSDYFYVWLRHSLTGIYSQLFETMLVPKSQELIATPFRFDGDREKANTFFEQGLTKAFLNINRIQNKNYPLTVFYAFKQAETEVQDDVDQLSNTASTGWETMLEGLINSGFAVTGTWPVRTELTAALKSFVSALASSIVLVCRPRIESAPVITRRDFLAALQREIPPALRQLQKGSIAPVDLAQAAIGPGMAVFSRYKQVLEADGSSMRVRTALGIINQALDEFLAEQEGEYDGDTRWALAWYEQYGHEQGPFGVAETLSKAKNVSVEGLVEAGILEARAGKVRILKREELVKGNVSGGMAVPTSVPMSVGPAKDEWDPQKDKRATSWEACQHLIYLLENGGEQAAANLLAKLGSLSDTAHDLAYRLYTICERKGWAQEALGYNMLAVAWPRLRELSRSKSQPEQMTF